MRKNKRIAIHHTCVFSVVGTRILCALDEESTPVPSYLPCDADVQAHSGRYYLKSGIAPAVSGCLIPHRLLPRRSPGRRGDWRGGLTAPPHRIPVHRLPVADSLARCLLSLPELGRYVRSSTTVARCCSRPIRSSPCGSPPPSMSILVPYFFLSAVVGFCFSQFIWSEGCLCASLVHCIQFTWFFFANRNSKSWVMYQGNLYLTVVFYMLASAVNYLLTDVVCYIMSW